MKNIHLIPTDKPSRLSILYSGKLNFGAEIMSSQNSNPQHIYVTTDDKNIKEGDWFLTKVGDVVLKVQKPERGYTPIGKKIILTTDQDLINDGVQAIGNEFLEWFVKNPSCEEVEVERGFLTIGGWVKSNEEAPNKLIRFEITIPKEEPKDVVLGYKTSLVAQMLDSKEIPEEPKQTYSEKQVKAAFNAGFNIGYGCQVSDIARKESICEEWFKQFKKYKIWQQ
jgi:hypothetical protein